LPWTKPYRPPKNRRLAPELYHDPSRVCYITIRAYRNLRPFVLPALNQGIVELLHEEQARQRCRVFTYCLMPDHLHLLASPCEEGVSVLQFVDRFKGRATNESWKCGWEGKLWQPRYYDHVVRKDEDLRAIAEYVLHNPVRQGLVESVEDWPWGGEMDYLAI
jgi:putative transposase